MSGRCSETEALNLLRPGRFSPRAAAKRLTDGIHDPDVCRLWCDGKLVPPDFVERLKVVARLDDGRWTARIVSAVGEAWEKASYHWEFDVDEVLTLLPVRRGQKGGNWEIHATLEMERLGRKARAGPAQFRRTALSFRERLEASKQIRPERPQGFGLGNSGISARGELNG